LLITFISKNAVPAMKMGLLGVLLLLGVACERLAEQEDVVARVGNEYLYQSELTLLLGEYSSKADSAQKANAVINDWAKKRILYQQAKINLSETDVAQLEKLIESYKYDLFNATYKEKMVSSGLDTLVLQENIEAFYTENNKLFLLNKPLYQVQYLVLPINNVQIEAIKQRFEKFTLPDLNFLDSLSFQFTRYSLKDSLWISETELFEKFPFLTNENLKDYLKRETNFEVEEPLDLYLFRFLDFKASGDMAPLAHVKSTIGSIILNQRKQKFLKEFEKDLLRDAIQTKKFETY
jgi:hypothetical protein